MVYRFVIVAFFFFLTSLSSASANILFEGYAKVLSGEDHIGYIVSRYEFEPKKKIFTSIYFLKTGKGAGEITESLKAMANSDLSPISYEYTSMAGKTIRTIDAKIKNGILSAVITSNGKIERLEKKIPKGTFLSTFLVYLMLKSKDGLKTDTNYEYQAIAEEDGAIYKGQALVGKEESHNGFKAFKILNTFKDSKFLSYVNERGEVLGTNALGQSITTQLVATPSEATTGQVVSNAVLKTLFGSIPSGQHNVVSRSRAFKGEEVVPQGKGIIIKSTPGTPGEAKE